MATLSQTQDEFLNRIRCLKHAFLPWIDQPLWVLSGPDKIPKQVSGSLAAVNDPKTWVTFEIIEPHITPELLPTISLNGSGLCVVDLDDCFYEGGIGGVLKPLPLGIVQVLQEITYKEFSRSGKGLHLICLAAKPDRRCKANGIEIYDSSDRKFMTLTGDLYLNHSNLGRAGSELDSVYRQCFPEREDRDAEKDTRPKSPPLSNYEVIALLCKSANGERFQKLFYDGDMSAYGGDASAADQALVNFIVFFTQSREQIFSLFKESALYKPQERQKKWEREDYRERTITTALKGCKNFYTPKKSSVEDAQAGSWDDPVALDFSENTELSFPLEALPECLRQAVEEVSRFAFVDPSIPLIPTLGMVCLSAGKKLKIEEKPGLYHHPSLFLAGVMDSGDRKSTVYETSLSLIMEEIEQERPAYEKKKAEVEAFNELIKESSEEVKKAKRKGEISTEEAQRQLKELYASRKKIPAEPENFADDITSPRLFQKLHLHGGAFGVFSSDARKIFGRIIGRGSPDATSEEDIYVSAIWGDTIYRSRVGAGDGSSHGEDALVRKPALTVCVLIQKDLWQSFATNKTMRESGLIARVCVVNPVSHVGRRLETEADLPFDKAKLTAFSNAVIRMRKWDVAEPALMRISKEAAYERRAFFNAIEKESGPGGRYEDVKDIASRITSITTRIAGALVILEIADRNELALSLPDITAAQWLRAQQIGEYFFAQSLDMQRRSGPRSNAFLLQKAARWLLDRLAEGASTTTLALIRNKVRGLEEERIAQTIADALEKAGWIRKMESKRKDSIPYEINHKIAVYRSDAEPTHLH